MVSLFAKRGYFEQSLAVDKTIDIGVNFKRTPNAKTPNRNEVSLCRRLKCFALR